MNHEEPMAFFRSRADGMEGAGLVAPHLKPLFSVVVSALPFLFFFAFTHPNQEKKDVDQ